MLTPLVYPPHLPPQVGFQHIDLAHLAGHVLLRATNTLSWETPDNLLLTDETICKQRDHILGFSINLLGTFKLHDIAIEIIGANKATLTTLWPLGTNIVGVLPTDFTRLEKAYYSIEIAKVHNKNTGVQANGLDVFCYIEHKPTHCNFWHFQLEFRTTAGELSTLGLAGNSFKVRKGELRTWLKRQVGNSTTTSPFPDIPRAWY